MRSTPRTWAIILLLVGLVPLCSAATPSRPNIILILADDLGYGDLGCYGQKLIRTPNIDRLAAEGIRFAQAYAGGSVCTPSRAVLMTGLHNGHAPARDNVPHYATYLKDHDLTIAEVLKQSGYSTCGVGKWSLGDAGTVGRATNQGFDHWLGYLNQDHAHYYFTEYLDDDEGRLDLRGNTLTRQHYSHHLLAARALKFIRDSDQPSRPYFLFAAFTLPHFSAKDEDEHGLTVPTTEPYSDRDWDERSKKFAAMVHMLDQDVGRIMELVDSGPNRDNTLIILTSDNGALATPNNRFNSSGPLRGFKRDLTEGGIRVPLIARWKGTIPPQSVSEQVIAAQDMLPTMAELAGASIHSRSDGISVVKALLGEKLTAQRDYLYWDYGHCRRQYDQAVRWNDWKGIREGLGAEIQLYDLSTDIREEHNVAAHHPDVVQRIREIMQTAPVPSERYPVGKIYKGGPLWRPHKPS